MVVTAGGGVRASTAGMFGTLCLLLAGWIAVALGQTTTTSPVDSTLLKWRIEVLRIQSVLMRNEPLNILPLCGSRSSGSDFNSLPSLAQRAERTLAVQDGATHQVPGYNISGTLQLAEQCFNIRTQLELGIRHIHLELHEVNGLVYVCKSQRALCQQMATATGDAQACQTIFGWPDLGNSTGCHASSPTLRSVLLEIGYWLNDNTDQFLVVRLHADHLVRSLGFCDLNADINDAIQQALSFRVFTPSDYQRFKQTASSDTPAAPWPSTAGLFALTKNIVFLSSCSFGDTHVIDYAKAQSVTSVINEYPRSRFDVEMCTVLFGSAQVATDSEFDFIYGDQFLADLSIRYGTNRQAVVNVSSSAGSIDVQSAEKIVGCGFSPMMASVGQASLDGCIWTYREGHTAYCKPNFCTVMSIHPQKKSRKYDWYNIPCTSKRRLLCYNSGSATWVLSDKAWAYPTGSFDDPFFTDENGINHDMCSGNKFRLYTTLVTAADVLSVMTTAKVSEVWLRYIPGVTCRPGLQNPAPTTRIPTVTSFDCPEVIKNPSIYASPAPTASGSTGVQATTNPGTSSSGKLTPEEQVGIIMGCLVVFTLGAAITYLMICRAVTNRHTMADPHYGGDDVSPGGPTLMHARRQTSGFGRSSMERQNNSSQGYNRLVNSTSPPTSPLPSSMGSLFSPPVNFSGSLKKNMSTTSPADFASPPPRPPDFPTDISMSNVPISRYTSSSSGIPGVTEAEGIVRTNPLFAQMNANLYNDVGDSEVDGEGAVYDAYVQENSAAEDDGKDPYVDTNDPYVDLPMAASTPATRTGPVVYGGGSWIAGAAQPEHDTESSPEYAADPEHSADEADSNYDAVDGNTDAGEEEACGADNGEFSGSEADDHGYDGPENNLEPESRSDEQEYDELEEANTAPYYGQEPDPEAQQPAQYYEQQQLPPPPPPSQQPQPQKKGKNGRGASKPKQPTAAAAPEEDYGYGLPMDAPVGLMSEGEVFY